MNSNHPVFNKCRYEIIANAHLSLNTAAEFAKGMGVMPQVLNYDTMGDAEINGKAQARFIARMCTRRREVPKLLLFGGEYTTRVTGSGRGGPNQHFLLSLLNALPEDIGIYALSADTDGQDGNCNAAGAWITPETKQQADALSLDIQAHLKNSDSFSFFEKLKTIIFAQTTHTNVNDFRAVIIPPVKK